jgi:ABC-type uncharacterized transport system substrate-binding protein
LHLGLIAVAMSVSACSYFETEAPPEPVVEAVPATPPQQKPLVVEPPPAPKPATPPIVEPEPLPEITIVLTSRSPAYEDVAKELGERLDRVTIYDLGDRSQTPVEAFRLINDSNSAAVVAIGLRAAKSAISMAKFPVIFSQVFNYEQHGLVTENSRGVSALPPLGAHLSAWKKIDPTLARVGMIIGAGHEDLVTEAQIAADGHGVELVVQRTSSDQETLYHFKRMIREIDGFWLFPDNRVLSPRVLQDMLAQANRRHVPVAVSHDAMLSMGAAISVSSVAADIASTIVDLLHRIEAGGIEDVPPVTGLSEVRVVTNDALLRRYLSADTQGDGS